MSNKLMVFDLDQTLIGVDSGALWPEYLVKQGVALEPNYLEKAEELAKFYLQGTLDMPAYLRLTLAPLSKIPKKKVDAMVDSFVDQHIIPFVFPEAKKLIAHLSKQKIPMLMISATLTFIVQPVGRKIGIPDALGIDLYERQGCYSSDIKGTMSLQEGKVTRLKEWLAAKNLKFERIVFYTDSFNDLPLCHFADEVFMVNPCQKLAQEGRARQWHELQWSLPG